MIKILNFIFLFLFLSFQAKALEPSSGLVCKNLKNKHSVEFLFKNNKKKTFAKAFKRINGKFEEVGNVVGKKLSSFILFEDKTMFSNYDFAWHLDEVTKNLKPYILSNIIKRNLIMPDKLSCISKNFWY